MYVTMYDTYERMTGPRVVESIPNICKAPPIEFSEAGLHGLHFSTNLHLFDREESMI